MSRGLYFSFEGIVGCGKTTQSKLFYQKSRREFPEREIVWTKEPGGTPVGDAIREILLHFPLNEGEMLPLTEAYLFAGSRSESIAKIVLPTLENGGVVVADRSIYSSFAFQAVARELGFPVVETINSFAVQDILPDKVILPDITPELGHIRKTKRSGNENDRFDNKDVSFHQKVREGYWRLAEKEPQRFIIIDGSAPIEVQAEIIWSRLSPFLDRELRQEGSVRRERG